MLSSSIQATLIGRYGQSDYGKSKLAGEEGVHISPGTVIKAENRIPRATKIEAGEVVPLRAYPL